MSKYKKLDKRVELITQIMDWLLENRKFIVERSMKNINNNDGFISSFHEDPLSYKMPIKLYNKCYTDTIDHLNDLIENSKKPSNINENSILDCLLRL